MDVDSVALYPGAVDLEPNGRGLFGGHIVIGAKPFDSAALFHAGYVDTGTTPLAGLIAWEANEAPAMNGATVVSLNRTVSGTTFAGILSEANNVARFVAYAHDNEHRMEFVAGGVHALDGFNTGADSPWNNYFEPLNTGWKYITGRMTPAGVGSYFLGKLPVFTRDTKTAMSVASPWLYIFNGTTDTAIPAGLQHAALVIVPRAVGNGEQAAILDATDTALRATGITPVAPEPAIVFADGNSLTTVSGSYPIVAAPSLLNKPPVMVFAESGTTLARKTAHLTSSINASLAAVAASGQRLIFSTMEGTNNRFGDGQAGGEAGFWTDFETYWAAVKTAAASNPNVVRVGVTATSDTELNVFRDDFNTHVNAGWISGGVVEKIWNIGADATVGPDAAAADGTLFSDTRHFTSLAVTSAVAPSYVLAINDILETQVATPTITPGTATYSSTQSVTLATTSIGATIYYTLDGSTPTTSSSVYSTALSVAATTTIKALGVKAGKTDSAVASATLTISLQVATPTFDLTAGSYTGSQLVNLADATSGSTIHYTTDGSTPTGSSTTFTAGTPIVLTASETIKAIAVKSGLTDSAVASAAYTIAASTFDASAHGTTGTLSNGNRDWSTTTASWTAARGNAGHTTGGWYFEIETVASNSANFSEAGLMTGATAGGSGLDHELLSITSAIGWSSGGIGATGPTFNPSVINNPGSGGTIFMVAVDCSTGNVFLGRDGTWPLGTPTVGSNTGRSNNYSTSGAPAIYPACSVISTGLQKLRSHFAPSQQTYSPPSGFSPWG